MWDDSPNSESAEAEGLTLVLISPDESRRQAVVDALVVSNVAEITEITAFPTDLGTLPRLLSPQPDVVLIDLDSDPEFALEIVENICGFAASTVMVCSQRTDLKVAVRCMRAGAREFLNIPIVPGDLAAALARVSVRRPSANTKKTNGKLFVFLGTKGGVGVTTLASNFAIALAQESGQKVLLIDLGVPLGDVAINLGIVSEYSTSHALRDIARLDTRFLATLLTTHSSELSVLAAPSEFTDGEQPIESIDKLVFVARQAFDYVVVDAGCRLDLKRTSLFDTTAIVYLITQVGVSELRNANRMITQFFPTRGRKLQIVLNRYLSQSLLYDEEHITRALTRPAQWRIPDDYATARRTQSLATPIVLQDTPISAAIRLMARKASGLPDFEEKKKGFSLFSKLRGSPKAFREDAEPAEEV
ncbi:MAG: AAA family ATPase [Terracidiphilus sp.]|jgi:pilus assembly protein CpaE